MLFNVNAIAFYFTFYNEMASHLHHFPGERSPYTKSQKTNT